MSLIISSLSPSRKNHPPLDRKNANLQMIVSFLSILYRSNRIEMSLRSSKYIKLRQTVLSPWHPYKNTTTPIGLRRFASVASFDHSPQLGENLHGFRLKRKKHVPELQLTAFQLEHKKTGAAYLHIDRDDKNNVFSIGFKTNPPDHTGVPHILEHTTLCGSQRYARQIIESGDELIVA